MQSFYPVAHPGFPVILEGVGVSTSCAAEFEFEFLIWVQSKATAVAFVVYLHMLIFWREYRPLQTHKSAVAYV